MDEFRICTKCKKEKHISEFSIRDKTKGSIKSWCKKCHNQDTIAYAKAHPKRTGARAKKFRETRKGHALFMHHRKLNWCRKHSVAYELSRDWYLEHLDQGCALTGMQFKSRTGPYSASVDRIDSTKGYTKQNCRMILFSLNAFKGTGTDQDMILIAKKFLNELSF